MVSEDRYQGYVDEIPLAIRKGDFAYAVNLEIAAYATCPQNDAVRLRHLSNVLKIVGQLSAVEGDPHNALGVARHVKRLAVENQAPQIQKEAVEEEKQLKSPTRRLARKVITLFQNLPR